MNTNPFFSIIIPVYNLENYIRRAISSIINQSFNDYEIIIINDGSTDNSLNIINEYLHLDNIILINHEKNESQHVSRIDGVEKANGKYILFLDGDDYFVENAFNILFETIQENPEYDFYEFSYIRQPSGKITFPENISDRFENYFNKDCCLSSTIWNKVYNSSLLKYSFSSMEYIYINNAEDIYESIIIAYYVKKTMITDKVIMNYQVGTGISTTYKDYDKTIEYLQSIKKTIELIENFLKYNKININSSNFNYKRLQYTIDNYINTQKNIEDRKKLFIILPNYFDNDLIQIYLLTYIYQLEESYKYIINSKNYKLGQFILNPIRIIKKIIRR